MVTSTRFLFAQEVARLMDEATGTSDATRTLHHMKELFSDEPHTPVVRYAALEMAFQGPLLKNALGALRTMGSRGRRFSPGETATALLRACCVKTDLAAHLRVCASCRKNMGCLAARFLTAFSSSEAFAAFCHDSSCEEEFIDDEVVEDDESEEDHERVHLFLREATTIAFQWGLAVSSKRGENLLN